jgi:hypothetical protein
VRKKDFWFCHDQISSSFRLKSNNNKFYIVFPVCSIQIPGKLRTYKGKMTAKPVTQFQPTEGFTIRLVTFSLHLGLCLVDASRDLPSEYDVFAANGFQRNGSNSMTVNDNNDC